MGASDLSFLIALAHGMLPRLSDGGIHSEADLSGLPVSQKVDGLVYPAGGDVHQFAYSRTTIHRNIYRIPIERGSGYEPPSTLEAR